MKIQSIYNSKILKQGLKFASNNGALFVASASAGFTLARLGVILATPKTDKENKKYACIKALSSSLVGYLLMLTASLPVSKAVKNIDKNPEKFLKPSTIQALKNGEKSLQKSHRYNFATQLFKLGLGMLLVLPKSYLTANFIPPLMQKIFPEHNNSQKEKNGKTTFTGGLYQRGVSKLSTLIGKIIDSTAVKKLSEKFSTTNFEQHIISLTDVFATGAFIETLRRNKKIKDERKTPLIYNSIISTTLSISGGYAINSLLNKPTEKFIENLKKANLHSPDLEKYINGVRIVKPALILGTLYYIIIPPISTFLADRFAARTDRKTQKRKL